MEILTQSIFKTDRYTTPGERVKASFIYFIISAVAILLAVISPIGLSTGMISSIMIPIIASTTLLLVYTLVRLKQLELASWILVLVSFSVIAINNMIDGSVESLGLLLNAALLLLGGFLLQTRGLVVLTLLSIAQLFVFPNILGLSNDNLANRLPLAAAFITIAAFVYAFNQFVIANRREGAVTEGAERFKLAEIVMRITQQASERVDLRKALNDILSIILDNYPNLYHAQVFLLDDDGIQARLVASTGEAGQQLIARGHSLAVGSLSVIGQVTYSGERVIAFAGQEKSVHRANELLPETTLEAAFPLRVGDVIIGALDLQSKTLVNLSANDEQTFQSLANSISLAIDSIRQFEQAKVRIEENQRLAEQTRSALHEVERLNKRLIGRAWSEYVRSEGDEIGLAIDFETDESVDYLGWTPTLADSANSNNLVQVDNTIAVPLRVRGEAIGAIEFELDADHDLTPEDIELILDVSERFGLAAENTRLLEESQRIAQREALINEITSRFQSSQNVEATLAEAARSLSDTFEAEKVFIRLGTPETKQNGKES